MAAAFITMPVDVCKTRLLSKQRAKAQKGGLAVAGVVGAIGVDEGHEMELSTNGEHNSDSSSSGSGSDSGSDSSSDSISSDSIISEMKKIIAEEPLGTLFLGLNQRLVYVGLANAIRLASYSTSRMDLMMSTLDEL